MVDDENPWEARREERKPRRVIELNLPRIPLPHLRVPRLGKYAPRIALPETVIRVPGLKRAKILSAGIICVISFMSAMGGGFFTVGGAVMLLNTVLLVEYIYLKRR